MDDLEPERQYQFWVTAVTNAGEGMRSDILVQTPSKRGNWNQSNLIHIHLTGYDVALFQVHPSLPKSIFYTNFKRNISKIRFAK